MYRWTGVLCLQLALQFAAMSVRADEPQIDPLRIVVMDPLCDQLSCDCVAGYAQRKYGELTKYLERVLRRPVLVAYAESLTELTPEQLATVDSIIGKHSVVRYDADQADIPIRTLAMLSGKDGSVTQTGMFVVRTTDKAQSIKDILDYRIMFGPSDCDEKHSAALAAMDVFGASDKKENRLIASDCTGAALAVVENDADAAVISDYAMPLLEGCGKIDKGTLRVVGRTSPVPFITVFTTARMHEKSADSFIEALAGVAADAKLLKALESKYGFVALPPIDDDEWNDWRGIGRNGICDDLPQRLPTIKQLLWSRVLTGHGLSGIAVDDGRLIVADKSLDTNDDVFRCLDADTGKQIWSIRYAAPGKMDFTNAPRANPVIHNRLVYLLGAYGDLHCVELFSGKVKWRRHLAKDFETTRPNWGYCSSPLIVDDLLIVNPGAKDASIAALNRRTGQNVWKTPGESCGYASFILATINGGRQIIGYESRSACGYDVTTGKRLWRLVPDRGGDFNVPTPIMVAERLLLSSENNGTRLYEFDGNGVLNPVPVMENLDMTPDMSTPIVFQGVVLGSFGGLACLDVEDGLKTCWETFDDPYLDYCSFLAGNGRILITSQSGSLKLLKPDKDELRVVSEMDLFDDVRARDRDVWSHPAVVGNRLFVRNSLGVYCFLLN